MSVYTWTGWEAEVDNDNDDDRVGVYYLTIRDPAGEEYAVIMHRTVGDRYPLDGDVAQEKVRRATRMVDALNDYTETDFDVIAEHQGWTQASLLGVCRDFIYQQGMNEALGEFAAKVAAGENGGW